MTEADPIQLAGDIPTLLAGTTVLRLFHGTAADFPGEPIAGLLGVDNIQAVGEQSGELPVPATLALLATGIALLGARLRIRR